jgi:sugar/nucleoside kinase (ribokinase family)
VIALIGNLSRDLLPGRPPQVGGGPFHGARALQRLRVPARLIARCDEVDQDELLPPLARLGTPIEYIPGRSTNTFSFSYEGDVRTMSIDALGDVWQPVDIPKLPSGTWVHVAPLTRGEFPVETVAALAQRRRVSFDGQGLVRVPEVGPLRLDAEFDRDLLRHISVLKLAEEEAEVLGDPAALGVSEVLVTHGSRGSTIYCGGGSEHVPARPTGTDPTGAGDAYSIAYVAGRDAGLAPAEAARRATAVVASMLSQ